MQPYHSEIRRRPTEKIRRQMLVEEGNDHDIAGTWYFEISGLMDMYYATDITWEIATYDGSGMRWASFDLPHLEGVLHFPWGRGWKRKERMFTARGTTRNRAVDVDRGAIIFISTTLCAGKWYGSMGEFDFTGKKVSRVMSKSYHELMEEYERLRRQE